MIRLARAMPTRVIALAAGLLATTAGHAAPARPSTSLLQKAIEEIAADSPEMPGVMAAVSSPRLGIEWQGAVGLLERRKPEALAPTDAFRIASVTKVFTSATALRLIESGKLGLYDAIAPRLSMVTIETLRRGGYDPAAITIEQLLTHTSGIFDYGMTDAYQEATLGHMDRQWTRDEQIAFAVTHGHKLSDPGKEYHYSDTGYVILGEIIERATGLSLPEAAEKLIDYKRLGLAHTYFEKLQPTPAGERRAHHYAGSLDVTPADPSLDLYGGGGIVSTMADLIRFFRPLLKGEIFRERTTLATALLIPPVSTANGAPHAPLLSTMRFGKRQCWSHGGFWGVVVAYCPDVDLAVVINFGQTTLGKPVQGKATGRRAVVARLAEAIERIESGTE